MKTSCALPHLRAITTLCTRSCLATHSTPLLNRPTPVPHLPRHKTPMVVASRLRKAPMADRLSRSRLDPTVSRPLLTMARNPRTSLDCMGDRVRPSEVDLTVDLFPPKEVEPMAGLDHPTVPHPPARVANPQYPLVFQ